MSAPLDHLVLATPDVDATAALVAQACGVLASPGGRHDGLGTRNALAALGGGAYLEIIGPDTGQPPPAGPRPFGIDGLTAATLVSWAVRVDGIDAAVAAARGAGWDPGDVVDLQRTTPSGEVLQWRLTFGRPDLGGVVPFLIDWGRSRHPSATASPGLRLDGFEVRHPDVVAVREALGALGVTASVAPAPEPGLRAALVGPAGRLDL